MQGLYHAIAIQKKVMVREKKLIHSSVPGQQKADRVGVRKMILSPSSENPREVVHIDLRFNFAYYVSNKHDGRGKKY